MAEDATAEDGGGPRKMVWWWCDVVGILRAVVTGGDYIDIKKQCVLCTDVY